VLTVAVSLVATVMALLKLATWLEAASFITGAICVWLTVKQNIWNFPLGLVNVATFGVVFYRSRLFADAGPQVVYFALGIIGWFLWLCGGENRTQLKVRNGKTRPQAGRRPSHSNGGAGMMSTDSATERPPSITFALRSSIPTAFFYILVTELITPLGV